MNIYHLRAIEDKWESMTLALKQLNVGYDENVNFLPIGLLTLSTGKKISNRDGEEVEETVIVSDKKGRKYLHADLVLQKELTKEQLDILKDFLVFPNSPSVVLAGSKPQQGV